MGLFAYTYHQYSLSRGNSSYIPPSRLMTTSKCARKADQLKQASQGLPYPQQPQLWAGEAGGSGDGGSDRVTNSFASGIWYLDSLGLYAATGTSVFARQDLVGVSEKEKHVKSFAFSRQILLESAIENLKGCSTMMAIRSWLMTLRCTGFLWPDRGRLPLCW